MSAGLEVFLNRSVGADPRELYRVQDDFYTPGFWTALVARARSDGLRTDQIPFDAAGQQGYASAIGLELALDGEDRYPFGRPNLGKNYSPLVLLESAEATDHANADINNCIRALFPEDDFKPFVSHLCEVVGELHDNVWSHGGSTGFSMAQKWRKPWSPRKYYFEFALADSGIGFLRELQRVGLRIETHQEAIDWCIVKGHSSKSLKPVDPWAQRLPPDAMGNPLGNAGRAMPEVSDHHLGLGLWKLCELVRTYAGGLWLATGNNMLHIRPNARSEHAETRVQWSGVALACRFDTGSIRATRMAEQTDDLTEWIAEFIGEGGGNLPEA